MTIADYVLDDRYTLIERIASGGMGEVWRGEDQILGRPVAIKMLAAVHAGDEQFRARFRAEARYASSLAHPGITRVFDYGEHSPLGGPYLVMELVDGQALSDIIERYGRLDPYVVLDIVAQAARALDAAHRAGIVHRDIKPGNLLIMADGTTKITDFGIAKAKRAGRQPDRDRAGDGHGAVRLPRAGHRPAADRLVGRVLPRRGGLRVPGRRPAVRRRAAAGDRDHAQARPGPAAARTTCRRPIADLVYAMLAKNPEDRPESALHVADRAEVIREARNRNGYSGPATSDFPVVPNFPPATSLDLYQGAPERLPVPRNPGNRTFLIAGIGAAAIGAVAIVAVLISSNGNSNLKNVGGNTMMPTQTQSQSASHKAGASPSVTQPGNFVGGTPGNGVVVAATGTTFRVEVRHPVEITDPDKVARRPLEITRAHDAPAHHRAADHAPPPTTHAADHAAADHGDGWHHGIARRAGLTRDSAGLLPGPH